MCFWYSILNFFWSSTDCHSFTLCFIYFQEYEVALQKKAAGTANILPLHVMSVQGRVMTKFSAYDCTVYPDEKHKSESSKAQGTVRDTMKELMKLQGLKLSAW